MPIPVCIKCKRKMTLMNGIIFLEYMDQMMGRPYKLWNADMVTCIQCGTQVVFRYANSPYAEHFHEDFDAKVQEARDEAEAGRRTLVEAY